jgi:hypothetical protein
VSVFQLDGREQIRLLNRPINTGGSSMQKQGLFLISSIILLLAALVLSACNTGNVPNPPTTGDSSVITWDKAVELINSGDVKQVSQTHSLDVTLDMINGEVYKTIEPSIDEVFKVIDACGDPCKDMILATE